MNRPSNGHKRRDLASSWSPSRQSRSRAHCGLKDPARLHLAAKRRSHCESSHPRGSEASPVESRCLASPSRFPPGPRSSPQSGECLACDFTGPPGCSGKTSAGVLFPHPARLLLLDAADSRVIVNRWMTAFPLVNLHPPALAVSAAAYLGARGAVYDRRPFRRVTLVRAPSAFAASRA